jgi:hypothetical protein
MKRSPVFLAGITAVGVAVSLALAYYDWMPVNLLTAP